MSPLAPSEIADGFRRCGVGPGDVLFLHCDALVLAQLPPMPAAARFDAFFAALDDLLGPDGTLVLPVFTYSFTKSEVFEPERTPSTVGALTEHFRTLPRVRRSRDPIFSVAARGRLAGAFADAPVGDCFGPQSAFGLLHRHDAFIACLGCSFRTTFTHFVEQAVGVSYRYFKEFSGTIAEEGATRPATVRYYVRDLARNSAIDLARFGARLANRGLLARTAVGRIGLAAVQARTFATEARAFLTEDPAALIAEGALAAPLTAQ
jgi:aminoglycoside 3-N-acetyltransferase